MFGVKRHLFNKHVAIPPYIFQKWGQVINIYKDDNVNAEDKKVYTVDTHVYVDLEYVTGYKNQSFIYNIQYLWIFILSV